MWIGVPRAARDAENLREGRSSCGKGPNDGSGRKAGVSRFRRGRYKRQRRRVIGCKRPVDRLVVQMADRAGRFGGAVVMVPDAAKRHADQQQREQRYRDDQIPYWLRFHHSGCGDESG